MAISDKLQSILNSKAAIKSAIEAKGVTDVGDVLSEYPDKIASIETGGGCTGFTGHADVEGLKAIGWTDDDIAYYQAHGVNWNEEDDEYHKVPQDNIDLYGVLTADNIQDYKDILVYCPKIDTSGRTDLSGLFYECVVLVAVPMIDTSAATNMGSMFYNCCSLTSVPMFDTSKVTTMNAMFYDCNSLIFVPKFDTSSANIIYNMFCNCHAVTCVPKFDTGSVTSVQGMFNSCYSLTSIQVFDINNATDVNNSIFSNCFSLQHVEIFGLNTSLNIGESSLLTKESLLYIINNEAATSAITITLSSYCYNKYKDDAEVTAALSAHPNVSLASA